MQLTLREMPTLTIQVELKSRAKVAHICFRNAGTMANASIGKVRKNAISNTIIRHFSFPLKSQSQLRQQQQSLEATIQCYYIGKKNLSPFWCSPTATGTSPFCAFPLLPSKQFPFSNLSTPASNQSSSVVVIPLPHQRARSLAAALSSSTLQPRQQAQTACWSFIVISRRHKQGAPSSSVEQKGMKNLLSSTSPLASGQRQETEFASTPFPSPSVAMRLWRPAAQRNLRNQWSKLLSYRQQWISASSDGRSHATSVVNAHLSHRYLPNMDLGVLKGMVGIQQRACQKLAQQQEHYQHKLLSSYKNMVAAVVLMVNVTRSMRCFLKGSSSSPIVQFSDEPDDSNDTGDGGGIPVFSSLSISLFENLAKELTQMFCLELSLKRLLVLLLLLISCDEDSRMQVNGLSWEEELYPGEFDDLNMSDLLYSTERCQPVLPRINGQASRNPILEQASHLPDRDILQVYLTAWLVEANIDIYRVDQIFALVGEEMNVNLS